MIYNPMIATYTIQNLPSPPISTPFSFTKNKTETFFFGWNNSFFSNNNNNDNFQLNYCINTGI